ncbi:MAG: DUF885 domain-containing protein [Planctomycetota bacterium]
MIQRCLAAAVVICLSGCTKPSTTTDQPVDDDDRSPEWRAFVSQFVEDYFAAHPPFAVMAGRHEFDGQLPDWSRAGIEAEVQRLHSARRTALAFEELPLSDRERFELEYVVARIDRDLFWLETAEWPFRCPAYYFDWMCDSLDPMVYLSRPYAPLEDRLRAFTKYAKAVPTAAQQIRENLRTPMPKTYVKLGIAAFGGLADFFENDVPAVFEEVRTATARSGKGGGKNAKAAKATAEQPADLWGEFEVANAAARDAMRELETWLKTLEATATDDFALGSDVFRQMVESTEGVELSLDRIEAAGEEDLARNLEALRSACERLDPNATVEECVRRVQAKKPEGGAVAGARRQLVELREFLVKNPIVAVPGTELALVEESPPHQRSNSAYIDIPGPYDKGMPSTYYIAPPDPSWDEEKQLKYIPGEKDLLFTSVHEVWPGHFLNFLHANRSKFLFGRVFVTYAFGEGWAHYTEEMMWEIGLGNGDPEVQIGQLLNALLRNARYLSAIGLHAKGMTVEESKQMFLEKAFQDEGTAEQQAARGTYDPAYLNYTLGKMLIRKLRKDWTRKRGGREAWRAFHDKFLSFGGPPIPLVRRRMLGGEGGSEL